MEPIEFDEGLKNKAYLLGSRLKNEGYDDEVILARLDKQGIPEELAIRIIQNLSIQRVLDTMKFKTPFYNIAIFRIAIGIFLAIGCFIIAPNQMLLPIGLIVGGVISAKMLK